MSDGALAASIAWLAAHHGCERSVASLFDGIGLPTPLPPDHAVRALRDAGFRAATIERPLDAIHPLLLPVVLLLEGGDACVLLRRVDAVGSEPGYEVVLPGAGEDGLAASRQVPAAALQARYTGWSIAATPMLAAGDDAGARTGTGAGTDAGLSDAGGHWLWGTMRRFVPYYRSTMVAALLSNVLMLATGLVTSVVFDKVIPHQAFTTLWALATGGFIAVVFDLLARQLRSHLIDSAGKKCDLIIGSLLFRHTLGLRMEHRPESAGAHSHHVAQIETVRDFFASATMAAFTDLPFIVLFIGMTFAVGGSIGWILVAAVPALVGLALAMQRTLRRSMHATHARHADLQGLMVEALEGLEDLKTTGAQGRFLRRFESAAGAAAEASIRARRVSSFTSNVSAVSQQFVTLLILVWGVYLIDDKVLSPGAMIACVMFGARAIAPLSSVVALASRYQGARAALQALERVMALPQEREVHRRYVSQPLVSGRIGLRDVGFAYPGNGEDEPPHVLRNLNLQFAAGERVVILGRIGSGKSTVLRLLAGLYRPVEGFVEVDGMDLRQLDPADFRRHVGFVSQEPRLFKGTLRENVLMGRAAADAGRLTEVATLTGLDRLVASHPQGWEMPVGEMGAMLSGGQRQLVALARALVTRPRILLMDEPTSSMDAQSELAFLQRLREAAGDCTLVMVTHRPAVLELAHRVTLIEGGRVVLDGPRRQVMAALAARRGGAQVPAPASARTPEPTGTQDGSGADGATPAASTPVAAPMSVPPAVAARAVAVSTPQQVH
ncbi:MAG: type I secretion system permease/ATPase [Lautropia sp.]